MNNKNNRWTTNGYYGSQPAPQKIDPGRSSGLF